MSSVPSSELVQIAVSTERTMAETGRHRLLHDHHLKNNHQSPSPPKYDDIRDAATSSEDNRRSSITIANLWAKAKNHEKKIINNLLHWKDMPKHLQFNPYIHRGYRPMSSAWGCVNSLFYMHNETINIVTHAIPILYILLTVPALLPWSEVELRFLAWCHFAGILCPWVGSFIYHLFMNLERGAFVYHRLLQFDMLGIWISQSFGAMPMVMATTYCLPTVLKWISIYSYGLLSAWGFYKAMTAWSPWERRLSFLMPFMMRILLYGLRFTSYGGGDPTAFQHIILQDVVSIIGAAIGALHIPEKWFPGAVDLYLNSHNIMHILVVAAVYSMHIATMKDLAWMSRANCNSII